MKNTVKANTRRWLCGLLALGALSLPWYALATPQVVASLLPIHSLVAGVMEGVAQPQLLITGKASPHDYHLRPSEMRMIANADVLFWVGAELEGFLVKPLHNAATVEHAAPRPRSVALLETPGITVLELRSGGIWEEHQHQDAHEQGADAPAAHAGHAHDPHIWLDPSNAVAMVAHINSVLSAADPVNQAIYQRNSATLIERLHELNRQLEALLLPVKQQPYLVFHDAYQYFERHYALNAVGSVVLEPEQRPGVKRVAEIQERMRKRDVRCVFSEPQFQPLLVETLIAGSTAHSAVLDPLGAEISPGPNAYFQLIEQLGQALQQCLARR